jgi:hypothetical protein
MPRSVYPIREEQAFLDFHISAGFAPRRRIENRSDRARPFERYWYGVFQKKP